MAAKVMLNSTSGANSIATDISTVPNYGGDGAVCDAFRARIHLNAGDKIYWSNYSSSATTLMAVSFGVPTEITLQYIASR
jgi:hypothetical protein